MDGSAADAPFAHPTKGSIRRKSASDTDREQGDDADSDHQDRQSNGIVIEPMAAAVNTHDASHPCKQPQAPFCSGQGAVDGFLFRLVADIRHKVQTLCASPADKCSYIF